MYCWWEGKLVQSLCNIVWRHLKNVKIKLPYGQAILRPNIYPKKMKTLTVKNIRDALFTIAKIWKQRKCPSIDEWIIKSRYTHTHTHTQTQTHTGGGILFSHKKKWNLATCNNIKGPHGHYALSEISQSEKDKYHMTSFLVGMWRRRKKGERRKKKEDRNLSSQISRTDML